MSAAQPIQSSSSESQRDFRISYADAASCSLMVGLGETYLPAFGLTVGLSQISAGLLSSLPLLTGGVIQLLAPRFAHLVGSCKRWVLACAGIQVLVFLFLALTATRGPMPPALLFTIAAIYWGAGLAAAPTWNNWIETIIPSSRITSFFTMRSRIIQIAGFLAFCVGGLWLQTCHQAGDLSLGYHVLFLAAATSRMISMTQLMRQRESHEHRFPSKVRAKVREAMLSFGRAPESRFLLYLLGTQVMVQISGPFFTPYMLGHLQLSYATYAFLISINYAARILAYPWVSRMIHNYGPQKSLRLGGLLIAASPLAWSFTTNISVLSVAQIFAGFAWALYELSTTLLIFEKIPTAKRTSVLSCYNFLNAIALVAGSLLGGWVLSHVPSDRSYQLLFSLSGSGRLATLLVLTALGLRVNKVSTKPLGTLSLCEAPPASLTPEPLPRAHGS